MRRRWRIQRGGTMPERVGGKARKKLCASVTSISPVVFNECATLYLESKSSAPRGRFSEMKAGIAKERIARLLRFPGWESKTLPDYATRNPAHIRRARPYDPRKKPPVLYSGRLFAYSKVWSVTRNASGERGHGCACRWGESGFAIARPPSSTSSLGKPMPMRIPSAIAPARASVCMPRRVNASMLRETSAYAV